MSTTPGSSAAQATAKEVVRWTLSQPQGVVSEIQILAVADASSDKERSELSPKDYVRPNLIRVIADSVIQRELDGKHKIEIELWTQGFCAPQDFPHPGRMCFASHCGESSTPMLASNVVFELRFPEAVKWKIVAVQYQRVTINSLGRVQAFLE